MQTFQEVKNDYNVLSSYRTGELKKCNFTLCIGKIDEEAMCEF